MKKIVIVGGGAGGMTAAAQLKRADKEKKIVVVEKGDKVSWAGCPIPYFIAGELPLKAVIHYTPDYFREQGIEIMINTDAKKINFEKKEIEIEQNGKIESLRYDELILSCGAKPIQTGIIGAEKISRGIFKISNADDGIKIKEFIEKEKPKKVVVAGSGFIGLEMAEAFSKLGLEVTIVEKSNKFSPTMSDKIREVLIKKCHENKIEFILDNGVKEVNNEDERLKAIILENGRELEADILLLSIGIRPNIDILRNSGYKFIKEGVVIPDKFLRIAESVYAIGDMILTKNYITDSYVYTPLGDVADKQALIVAQNIMGKEKEYKGVLQSFATSFFEIKIAGTGLKKEQAEEFGYNAESIVIKAYTKNGAFAGYKPGEIEVIYDKDKNILLGAFMTGEEAAAQFIDLFSVIIYKKIPVEEFIDFDYSYSPVNSVVWNPLLAVYRKLMLK